MNIANMRVYVRQRYAYLNGKGGVRVPTEKASDNQIMAVYHTLCKRKVEAAEKKKQATQLKKQQYEFNF